MSEAETGPGKETKKTPQPPRPNSKRAGPEWVLLILGWLALVLSGFAGLLMLIQQEKQRDLQQWQVRLELAADAQARDISEWIGSHLTILKDLADNPSLQLYMTELSMRTPEDKDAQADAEFMADAPAQTTYMRHLLDDTAGRHGFSPEGLGMAPVKANVKPTIHAGLALLDRTLRPIVTSGIIPPLEGELERFIRDAKAGQADIYGPYDVTPGHQALAFLLPIYPVQSDPEAGAEIGYVFAVRMLDQQFYTLLQVPTETAKTAESVLIRSRGSQVVFLSPLLEQVKPYNLSLNADTEGLAAAYAIRSPQHFAIKQDYRNRRVVMTSQAIDRVPWVLMRKIDTSEAMHDSLVRARWMVVSYALLAGLLTVSFIAVWRQSGMRKAKMAATRYKSQAGKIERQEKLLALITESTPNAIFIVDTDHRYRYVNRVAAEKAGMRAWEMIGKSMVAVLGASIADRYVKSNRTALANKQSETQLYREESADGPELVLQSTHIPLPSIPMIQEMEETQGVLIVERDLTAVVQERERREQTLKALVEALITIVDQRDPYAVHHSSRVAMLAREIAKQMNLGDITIETSEIAGSLMNLGKILVPESLLTHEGKLDEKDREHIRASLMATADLLKGVAFDGPVVETLRQAPEHYDGSGPIGTKGDELLPAAQIVAVANAFVAMVSKRAYRRENSIDQALQQLLAEIDKRFDRAPVVALVNFMDNAGGRHEWERLVNSQEKAITNE